MSDPRRHRLAQGPLTPLVTALAVAAALLVPLAGVAHAQILTKVDAIKEDADVTLDKKASTTATLKDENGADFEATSTVNVDFEYVGANDPDGFSPTSPDDTCNLGPGFPNTTKCTKKFGPDDVASGATGPTTVYVWIDVNGDPDDSDLDASEVQGDQDNDMTDVVTRTWFVPAADTLNCYPEKATAEDGQDVTVNCRTDATQAGIVISGENLGGANDPDDPPGTITADYYPGCVTDATGACTLTIAPSDTETGSANACFWVDEEDDGSYHPAFTAQWDGSRCDEESLTAPEEDDATDVVQLGWGDRRTVSIKTPTLTKKWGSKFTISGTVTSNDQACIGGVPVAIQRDAAGGSADFVGWRQKSTGGNGSYSISVTAFSGANYRAVVADEASCLGDVSGIKRVKVAKKVTIGASDRSVRRGQIVRINGKVAPCKSHKRKRVFLQRKKGGVFRRVATAKSNGGCRATFSRTIGQTTVFRIRAKKTGPAYEAGTSPGITVRAT